MTICLSMIVRNEEHCIERCLASVAPFVDDMVIIDTGSTDRTVEIIKDRYSQALVMHCDWVNFGYNRTEALNMVRLFRPESTYAWVIDADEEFRPTSFFGLPTDMEAAAYYAWQTVPEGRYLRAQLLRLDQGWWYEGVVHEFAAHPLGLGGGPILPHCTTHGHFDSARNQQGQEAKMLADAELLAHQPTTPRNVFYTAESYRGAKQWQKALAWYSMRVDQEGWDEERWYAAFMKACCMSQLNLEPREVAAAFLHAIVMRPQRAETYFEYARYLQKHGQFDLAKVMHKTSQELPVPDDALNINLSCYAKGT